MVLIGIFFGFGAAVLQSFSYIFSRMFLAKFGPRPVQLLIISHVIMGGMASLLLPFVWPSEMPPLKSYVVELIICNVTYLLGQIFFFMALNRTDASRVSPLLGIKIFLLALVSIMFLGKSYASWQWFAIFLGGVAAVMTNWSGKTVSWQALLFILLACVGYCASDIYIRKLTDQFPDLSIVHRSLLSASICYILCGMISFPGLFFFKKPDKSLIKGTLPFALAWFLAMLCLYVCFSYINVVYGNIIQSSRGLISVILGAVIAKFGYEYLEEKVTMSVLSRRIFAAAMMTAAIALFYLGSEN